MKGYVLKLDLKAFFPNWDKMTQEEKKAWRKKWRALKARQQGNNGVTPG